MGVYHKPACIGGGNGKWLYDSQKQKDQELAVPETARIE
jgi:hypothetical protein